MVNIVPRLVSKKEFAFYHSDVVLGTPTDFLVGHTLLPKGAQFTLTFDATFFQLSNKCLTDSGIQVLSCTSQSNSRSFACVKQDTAVEDSCRLRMSFDADFSRTITVTSAFTGLADGMVFNPTFTIDARGAQGTTSVLFADKIGGEVLLDIAFPKIIRKTDIVRISNVSSASGTLMFSHLEATAPIFDYFIYGETSTDNDATSSTVNKNNVSIQNSSPVVADVGVGDGFLDISLANIDETAAFLSLLVYFVHIATPGSIAVAEYSLTVTRLNSMESLGSATIRLASNPLYIGFIPSAKWSTYKVVKIVHPDMSAGDTITFNDLTYLSDADPQLRCDGLADPIVAGGTTFTLPSGASVSASQPCYAIFWSYGLFKPYWSITARVGVQSYHYAAIAETQDVAPPSATSDAPLVKSIQGTAKLHFPDFTSALAPSDQTSITFAFDPTQLSIDELTCGPRVASIDATAGTVTISFADTPVPLAEYGTLTCDMKLTPLVSAEFPVLSATRTFGQIVGTVALPPFQDLVPTVSFAFPSFVVKTAVTAVELSISHLAVAAGDTVEIVKPLTEQFITLNSCVGLTVSANKITFTEAFAAAAIAKTYLCSVTSTYLSEASVDFITRLTRAVAAAAPIIVDFNGVAPPSFTHGFQLSYVTQNESAAVYKVSYRYLENTAVALDTKIILEGNDYLQASIETDCPTVTLKPYAVTLKGLVSSEFPLIECNLRVVFKSSYYPDMYNPDPDQRRLVLFDSTTGLVLDLPSVIFPQPSVVARIFHNRVVVTFSNTDANAVTINNIWGIATDDANPIKVYAAAGGAEVGHLTVDDNFLNVNLNDDFVSTTDGKYSVSAFYFDLPSLHGRSLQSHTTSVKFVVGSTSTAIEYTTLQYAVNCIYPSPILTPGELYALIITLRIADNVAKFTLDHTNTALTSVVSCAAKTRYDEDFLNPVHLITDNSSFSFVLASNNTILGDEGFLSVKCMFETVSVEQAKKNVGKFTKNIKLAILAMSNLPLFSTWTSITTPYFAPLSAVSQVITIQRSKLFTSSELAVISKIYASALRKQVFALLDSQVAVTGQRLDSVIPSDPVVPDPIVSRLGADTVALTFTTSATLDVAVTSADVDAAAADIIAALSGYSVTLSVAADAIVDGECAYRCGVGCALCAEGKECSADGDCTEGKCSAFAVCTSNASDPQNAASTASLSLIAVVALVTLLTL